MDGGVFEDGGGGRGACGDASRKQCRGKGLLLSQCAGYFFRAIFVKSGERGGAGVDFREEHVERGVGGGESEPVGTGVEGLGDFGQGEQGQGRAVVCFDVGWIEAEGGGAVKGCGAIVF